MHISKDGYCFNKSTDGKIMIFFVHIIFLKSSDVCSHELFIIFFCVVVLCIVYLIN